AFAVIPHLKAAAPQPRARDHHSTIGEAIKIEENVPKTTPIMMAREKSGSTAPPNKSRQKVGINVTLLVRIVRLSVWLMLEFIISSMVPRRPLASPSRIRSYTTMVSLME